MDKQAVDLSAFAGRTLTATTCHGDTYVIEGTVAHVGYVGFQSTDAAACSVHAGRTDARRVRHGLYALDGHGRIVGTLAFGRKIWLEPDGGYRPYATDPITHVLAEGRTIMGCERRLAERRLIAGYGLIAAAAVAFIAAVILRSDYSCLALDLTIVSLIAAYYGDQLRKRYRWTWAGF